MTVTQRVWGSVHEVETRWYDTARWSGWVDGFDHIVATTGEWPRTGASVTWQSGPAGRGRVTEQVSSYEPLQGQELEVEDDAIRGRQRISFNPSDDAVEVELSLEYEIKQTSFFTPLIDLLFIRRAMASSLQATLSRFGGEFSGRAG